MAETFKVQCIKCSTQYVSQDPDPYYCDKCNEERKKIAIEVDKKVSMRPRRQGMSELQMYDALRQSKGSQFVHIKDLGIKL